MKLTDAAGKEFEFAERGQLLEFLEKESRFWANAKSQMKDLDDNEIHKFVNSSDTRFKPCISEIESRINRGRSGKLPDNTRDILQNHLGDLWLWSRHDYTSSFIKINNALGERAADDFIRITISFGHLNNRFDAFNREHKSWTIEIKQNWNGFLDKSSNEQSDQLKKHKDEYCEFLSDSKGALDDLKQKYEKDLRYSPSVIHWQNAAKKYEDQGKKWADGLFGTLAAGLLGFAILFNTWLEGRKIGVDLDTVQGVILFGTVLATFAFLVRILSRLTFSSYHLMRDAGERELLTYLYLSLINEKKIDESSRNIILQALFSRTESGLLAGDSSPTMPNLGAETINSAMKQSGG